MLLIDNAEHVQCLVGDTFSGSCSSQNEALEVGVVLLAGRTVAEEYIRYARAHGRECGEKEDVLLFWRRGERKHVLNTVRKFVHVKVLDDAEVFLSLLI